jgi:AbiV family abortive infection protein
MANAKIRNYELTLALLQQYHDAALVNSSKLLIEANLLLEHGHHARAYFLAVATIEEVGKAVQAYDGLGRNLKDSAGSTRLKLQFEDHSQKITSAFIPWIKTSPNIREELITFMNLMIDVKKGREPSMYVDIQNDSSKIVTPELIVRPEAARDCIRLAYNALTHAQTHIIESTPNVKTRVQDAFFALKPTVYRQMMNTEDFWWYYISRMEAGGKAFETATIDYQKKFASKNLKFKAEES